MNAAWTQGAEGLDRDETGAPALEVVEVARRFGRRWALRGVTFRLEAGEAAVLVGPNGSGKTTLLRIAATALRPTRGAVRVFGRDVVEGAAQVRERVGLLGYGPGLYEDLTAAENLRFALAMGGTVTGGGTVEGVLREVGLAEEGRDRVRTFSSGMRRRLALGRLLLRPPRLLLLDEPYAGFDAAGIGLVNGFVERVLAAGGAAVLATHDPERAAGVAPRRLTLREGRLVEDQPAPDGRGAGAAAREVGLA